MDLHGGDPTKKTDILPGIQQKNTHLARDPTKKTAIMAARRSHPGDTSHRFYKIRGHHLSAAVRFWGDKGNAGRLLTKNFEHKRYLIQNARDTILWS